MIIMDAVVPFTQTPLGIIVTALVSASIIAMAGAVIKMMVDIATLRGLIEKISEDVLEIRNDKDTMKWSEYLRGIRNRRGGPPKRGD
jgi:hypothetical protein